MSANGRSAVELLRFMFGQAHQYLEGTMMGVTDEVAQFEAGQASNILGQYAHIVTSEDWLINIKAGGSSPVMMRTNPGFQAPPPPTGWNVWAREQTIDRAALHAYAQEVYAATDAFLAAADDSILTNPVDMSEVGFGTVPTMDVLNLALLNAGAHCGEISTLKGLQGLQGYPA